MLRYKRFTLTKLSPQSFGIIACQSPAAVWACCRLDRTTLKARFLSAKFVAHFLASSVVPTFSYILCFEQAAWCRTGIEKSPWEKLVEKAKRRQGACFVFRSSSIDFRPERRLLLVSLRVGQIANTEEWGKIVKIKITLCFGVERILNWLNIYKRSNQTTVK